MTKLKNWQIGLVVAALVVVAVAVWLVAFSGKQDENNSIAPVATSSANATGNGLQAIQERGVLKVGINPGIAPMEFLRDGEIVGFDVDLTNEIGKQLGVQVEFVVYDSLEDLVVDLVAGDFHGNYDMAISALGLKERRLVHSLAVPYFQSGLTILTTANNEDITDFESLKGHTVAAVVGSGEYGDVSNKEGVTVVDASNYTEVVDLVATGKADAAVLDVPVALRAVKENDNLRVVAEPFEESWYGIYIEGDDIALFEKITEIVKDLKANGTYESIYAKWF